MIRIMLLAGFSLVHSIAASGDSTHYSLAEREGRTWLVTPGGGWSIMVGINHLSSALRGNSGGPMAEAERTDILRRMDRDLEEWHFNTVGYGAPRELWKTHPFIAELELTQGMRRENGRPYNEITAQISEINARLLERILHREW